ncbi:RNA 3'-phosphate cyclase [Gloeothece citriformis PCC 7424]|uniref:RNA 3'-terminal phosphate cyclase n=1 Tax=Gloeothece citriformis (strain PCC 7424) TaxID=65393 RepID=RTCA_GLOC7|nr:RNA 3'-terminal phosphate cyclase [Gloeothece citriformis]B7KCF3.1 RecName: Full=RNA 3'-terminal phosphate cyclase; Short=RNA cyclase; Short=RNA-3'-phosphate cyclase [Gloeothece citriformis PCC 7424]ACK70258.1 RNA 3'-phosphate cyclase [Gloeothece citriformis PCC 7424]
MLDIDGSWGEGGGQILRTTLSLSAITGQPIRLYQIRAGRQKPGLSAQHLTCVRAAATICNAEVRGDKLRSTLLEFIPTRPPQAGHYTFDVMDAQEGGSAGAVTLILQTILLPLAIASEESTVILKGGTHVAWSPPISYIEQVYLPLLSKLGLQTELHLQAWGWYPQGGGEVHLHIKGNCQLQGVELLERGALKQVKGLAVVTELPSHIPQRMAMRCEKLLQQAHVKGYVQPLRAKGVAPGAGVFLTSEYEHICAGFAALGRRGLPAESVAQNAVEQLLSFHQQDAPVEEFLGDQLLLPMILAQSPSQYRVAHISEHLKTNVQTISQFGLAQIDLNLEDRLVFVKPGHNLT